MFEKTCATTQKSEKSRFFDFEEKNAKNIFKNISIVSQATLSLSV